MCTTGIFQYGILFTRANVKYGTIQLSIKDNYELDRNILTDMFILYSRITEPKEDF
ncbi:hypothetical protein FDI90_gp118 [Pseudomonas phage PA7]|uniref:Uncharacterized protein n=1 Tax=Pseudomonas phage PA7 TaxID=347330 RepID=I7DKF9_9CAUD|nr:hypothetical protein FDI90_gp118 [Pseudomonas phage PA7]AFO70925.1 hypothetical protein [Pseudomonas phage PA7]